MSEETLKEIRQKIRRKYDVNVELVDNKLHCNAGYEYISNEERYLYMENLSIAICDDIQEDYECFCDYSISDTYEFVIEIF